MISWYKTIKENQTRKHRWDWLKMTRNVVKNLVLSKGSPFMQKTNGIYRLKSTDRQDRILRIFSITNIWNLVLHISYILSYVTRKPIFGGLQPGKIQNRSAKL